MSQEQSYSVSVDDERTWLPRSKEGEDFWENHGFMVRGRTEEGDDLTLWVSPYIVKQGSEDSYYAVHANINQTVLVHGNRSRADKQQMHDSDFVALGWSPGEHLPFGTIETDETDERVVWKVQDRRYTDAPPRWSIQGEQGGVDLDIEFEAILPAFWFYPFDRIEEDGIGWYEAYLRASGTITQEGKELAFTGYACHERIRMTRDHVPDRLSGEGLQWQHLLDERVQCWMMASPTMGDAFAYLAVDGEVFEVRGEDKVRWRELAHWQDPRSKFTHAYKWQLEVECDAGTLELVATAYDRAYYVWPPFKATTNVLHWMVADATGSFAKNDGTVISFTDALYMPHSNRAFFHTGGVRP